MTPLQWHWTTIGILLVATIIVAMAGFSIIEKLAPDCRPGTLPVRGLTRVVCVEGYVP